MLEDTIIAISTPPGYGGIGIIRLSGPQALEVAKRFFKRKDNRITVPFRRPILGYLWDFEQGDVFEEAYLTYFPAPKSYTTEDVVEISCHGSPVILEEVIRLGQKAGARLANPGEFTLRAFLGGRIDMLQAEAINDIIQAVSLKQAKISYQQLEGNLSKKIKGLRQEIIHILSQIEASIEFPDEGLHLSTKIISKTIKRALNNISSMIQSYDLGRTFSEGLSLAIAGKSNVGKSTLFNTLLDMERAIVTPFPGTTRDFLRENIKIQDSVFTLIDMAGMDNTSHPIEKAGIRKGKKIAQQADGILLVLDASRGETQEDLSLIRKHMDQKTIIAFNKSDLPVKMNTDKIKKIASDLPCITISALKGNNIPQLKELIHTFFKPDEAKGKEIILHLRQKLLLEKIHNTLLAGLTALKNGYSEEVWAEDIRQALPHLGQLTGEIRPDDVLEDIFSRFCIGK